MRKSTKDNHILYDGFFKLLPKEIMHLIVKKLSIKETARLTQLSKSFYDKKETLQKLKAEEIKAKLITNSKNYHGYKYCLVWWSRKELEPKTFYIKKTSNGIDYKIKDPKSGDIIVSSIHRKQLPALAIEKITKEKLELIFPDILQLVAKRDDIPRFRKLKAINIHNIHTPDINILNWALLESLINQEWSLGRKFIWAGADINGIINSIDRTTILHCLIQEYKSTVLDKDSFEDVIKCVLYDYKANPNVQDQYGNSPLHYALYYALEINFSSSYNPDFDNQHISSLGVCEKLLLNGADINLKNKEGQTPLYFILKEYDNFHYFLRGNRYQLKQHEPMENYHCDRLEKQIEFLISKGAFINAQDNDGNTILHYLLLIKCSNPKSCPERCILFLLNHNIDVDLKNKKEQTALDMINEYQINLLPFYKDTILNGLGKSISYPIRNKMGSCIIS